ncbi:NADH-cytochrome b5 reductase-like [Coemansia helicoidea]|uniref:NADH-cytochrome b5 reductase-like n=1 Tax=Coemansia helicoidea TaxID=1286919 RepID=A0ACC1LFQ5_9FUNG|nr:NADH-cytochrome b5 reductase-like [Coemansia helicoidea]
MGSGVNPAVQELLEEIARAKARAEARRQQRDADAHQQYGILRRADGTVELREPPAPVAPEASDCCHSGCTPCIMDTFREHLQQHERQVQVLREQYQRALAEGTAAGSVWHEPHGAPCGILDPLKFVAVRVMHVERGEYWRMFVLEATSSDFVLALGEHIHIRAATGSSGGVVTRPFTPVVVEDVAGLPRPHLFVRLYDSALSRYFAGVAPGDALSVRGPIETNEDLTRAFSGPACVLVAGGSGIAPIFQIIRFASLNAAYSGKRIVVVHCARDASGLWLRDEIARLADALPHMSYHPFLSRDASDSAAPHRRRLSAAAIRQLVGAETGARAVVCGPGTFNSAVAGWLRGAGIDDVQRL